MCPAVDNLASYDIHAVIINFLNAKNMSVAEICHDLFTAVHDQNLMSDGNV
jgi:hypothetical protein